MSIASIQETLLTYTMEKSDITSRLSTIMSRMTLATTNTSKLLQNITEKRSYYYDKVAADSSFADTTEYKVAMQQIEDDYDLQMAEINNWQSSLEQEKNNLETRMKIVTSFEESWTAILKNNVKKDFSYFSMSSSS